MNKAHFSIYTDPSPACDEEFPILKPTPHQPLFQYTQSSQRLRLRPAVVGSGQKSVFVQNNAIFAQPPPKSARPGYKPKNMSTRMRDSRSSEKSSLQLGISIEPVSYQQTDQKCSIPFKPLDTSRDKLESSRRSEFKRKSSAVRSFMKEPMSLVEQLNAQLVGDCGIDIAQYLRSQDHLTLTPDCLAKHDITKELRCKMVDWMIEVLTNFKSQDQTLFLAISLLDRYFAQSDIKCTVVDLHLAGIIGMFAASKLEDPLPLTLELAHNNIGHKRFTQEELRIAELKILSTLQWRLHVPTIYESILTSLQFALPLTTPAPSSYKQERIQLQKFAVYLAMLTLHDYELITKTEAGRIARACLRTALKLKIAREQKHDVLKSLALFSQEQFAAELMKVQDKESEEEHEKRRIHDDEVTMAVEDLYYNFEEKFPGIQNLRQLCKDVLPERMGLIRTARRSIQ